MRSFIILPLLLCAVGLLALDTNNPPVCQDNPGLQGTNVVGQVLTSTVGTWTDAETPVSSLTFAYQWWRADNNAGLNAAAIPGATGSTYTVSAADSGKALRLEVLCTDTGYGTAPPATTTAFTRGGVAAGDTAAVPLVTSSLTATGVVGDAFSYQVVASNSPLNYVIVNLPAGWTTNGTGGISGILPAAGMYGITIVLNNVAGSSSAVLSITTHDPVPTPNPNPTPTPVTSSSSSGGGGGCNAGAGAGLLLGLLSFAGFRRRRE
ncbi:MAG: hypothetical protein WC869_00775 [Phycisphaerae bacterium]|jgi:hypothetical protein